MLNFARSRGALSSRVPEYLSTLVSLEYVFRLSCATMARISGYPSGLSLRMRALVVIVVAAGHLV